MVLVDQKVEVLADTKNCKTVWGQSFSIRVVIHLDPDVRIITDADIQVNDFYENLMVGNRDN